MDQAVFDITKIRALQNFSDKNLKDVIIRTLQKLPSLHAKRNDIYNANDLRSLFQFVSEPVPDTLFPDSKKGISFPNTAASLLCLEALRLMGVSLSDRSKIAGSILKDMPQSGEKKDVHEIMSEFKTNACLPILTLTAIKRSRTSFRDNGQYTVKHIRDLFAYAHEDISLEAPEISGIENKRIVTFPNIASVVLCLDGLKDEDASPQNSVLEREKIVAAFFSGQTKSSPPSPNPYYH